MVTPTRRALRVLSVTLLNLEASAKTSADPHEAVVVCEKLRFSLTRLAGADGFTALMRRALTLARTDFPLLETVKVTPDCGLEGLRELAENDGNDAAAAIITNLLSLLVTFIGEPMTMRLVRESWPAAGLNDKR